MKLVADRWIYFSHKVGIAKKCDLVVVMRRECTVIDRRQS